MFTVGLLVIDTFAVPNAQRHRRTDGQTDCQTDVVIMPIVDHTSCSTID